MATTTDPRYHRPAGDVFKTSHHHQQKLDRRGGGPSTSQILAVVATLFPLGFILLCIAGLILAGTLIALAVATPLFILFSPILVPAVISIATSVFGFMISGAFGVTALSSISWLLNYVRRMGSSRLQGKGTAGKSHGQSVHEPMDKTRSIS